MSIFLRCISIILVLVFVSGFVLFFSPLPPLLNGVSFSREIYDSQHRLLKLTLSSDQKYRVYVPLADIPPQLKTATLLQEDQYFAWHYGVNPIALMKASWNTYIIKSRREGASTITMQVARLRYGIHSKTIFGKLWQIIRALQVEMHYSKNQILEAYFNLAPYGNNIEGVGAASLIYFNQPIKNITLPEVLTLAVIPQNPIHRTPSQNHLKESRNKLFYRWLKLHPEDKNQTELINLPLQMQTSHQLPFHAPHLVELNLKDDSSQQQTETTLDLDLQRTIEHIATRYITSKNNLGVNNAAVLLVDTRDMSVKALMGSMDFFDVAIRGQIDGTNIKRSPGSTLKPFIYALALDQGLIHPDTILKDVPQSFGNYSPDNFDYDFFGPIHAKDALVLSRNVPAVYLEKELHDFNLYALLQKTKIRQLKPEGHYGLALALGGVEVTMQELTSLYAMLVNDGNWQPLRFEKDQARMPSIKVLSPEAAYLTLDMLKNTPRPAENSSLGTNQLPISWKTGTSSGYHDAWTVGVIGPYVLTVWVGNFDNRPNPAFVGKDIAAPLFFQLVDGLNHAINPIPALEKNPDTLNLTKVPVCKASGLLPTRYCRDTELTWFIPGKSPIKSDTIFREVAIDKKTGLRTCHFDKNTQFKIYEFWSSDLLTTFKAAGIARQTPPSFDPRCSALTDTGISPQITSPKTNIKYAEPINNSLPFTIPFTAVTDADVATLYWFLNDSYLGKTERDQPYLWKGKIGHYIVRVVDDHGRSDARDIKVESAG